MMLFFYLHTHTQTLHNETHTSLYFKILPRTRTCTYACWSLGGVKQYSENLGEFLRGDKIENSAYQVRHLFWHHHRNIIKNVNTIFLITWNLFGNCLLFCFYKTHWKYSELLSFVRNYEYFDFFSLILATIFCPYVPLVFFLLVCLPLGIILTVVPIFSFSLPLLVCLSHSLPLSMPAYVCFSLTFSHYLSFSHSFSFSLSMYLFLLLSPCFYLSLLSLSPALKLWPID